MHERRGNLHFAEKALAAERGGKIGAKNLERDLPLVLEVTREEHSRHPAASDFLVDIVLVGQCDPKALKHVIHATMIGGEGV